MKVKEVIVVEGKDDTAKIKQTLDADTIETNGSAINHKIMEQIAHAKEKRGVIIFTDPDYPGQRIRQIIDQNIPGCKHAFLSKQQAIAKGKKGIGIEHASPEAIKEALEAVYELRNDIACEITKGDLIRFGLIGGQHAKDKREKLGDILKIGYVNGKQLLKRLEMFHISKEEFEKAMAWQEDKE